MSTLKEKLKGWTSLLGDSKQDVSYRGKEKVDHVAVLTGEQLLQAKQSRGESVQLSDKEKASMQGKYFMDAKVGGRWLTMEIDKNTYDRVSAKWMNDRAEDFCKVFGVNKKYYDFKGIGADYKGTSSSVEPTNRNAIDMFRGLDTSKKQVPKELQTSDHYAVVINAGGTEHVIPVNKETMAKIAGMSEKDRQTYFERITKKPVSSGNVSIRTFDWEKGAGKEIMTGKQLDSSPANQSKATSQESSDIQKLLSKNFDDMMNKAEQEESQSKGLKI